MKNCSDVLYDGLRNWIITHFVIYLWSCFQVFATDAIQECSPMCKIQVLLITVSVNIGNVILIQNISFLFPVRQRQTNLILSRPHNFFMTIWFIIPPTRKQMWGIRSFFPSVCLFDGPYLVLPTPHTPQNKISWNFQELVVTWCFTVPSILHFDPNGFLVS